MLSLRVTHLVVAGTPLRALHTFCYQSSHHLRVSLGYKPSLWICSFSVMEDSKRKIGLIHPNLIYSLHYSLASAVLVGSRNEILPHSCECHCHSLSFWLSLVKPVLYLLTVRSSSFLPASFKRAQRQFPIFFLP